MGVDNVRLNGYSDNKRPTRLLSRKAIGMCRRCPECDGPLEDVRDIAIFCSRECKNKFNNRRLLRGAEIYDLFMAVRYQRGLAKALGLWSIICGLANTYHKQDEAIRPGFKSWMDPVKLLATKPMLTAKAGPVR